MSGSNQIEADLSGADWLAAQPLQKLFDVLEAGGEARVAGGAVRDALLGRPVTDVDIATTLRPEEVMERLAGAGFKAVPTGIRHGTVTAVMDEGGAYEVTTLREDVETDGRHATVAFTSNWAADAGRRDFTMNALYCDRKGALFDPLGGYPDLAQGRVRFVGDAARRIEEDYLRILRFFRFQAVLGRAAIDAEGLEACVAHKDGLVRLSRERVRQEFVRLVVAPGAVAVLSAMEERGILAVCISFEASLSRFERLCRIEEQLGLDADPIRRLAALLPGGLSDVPRMRDELVLTGAEAAHLAALRPEGIAPEWTPAAADAALYRMGVPVFVDSVLLGWAAAENHEAAYRHLAERARTWKVPRFPLGGQDAVNLGVEPGPRVGRLLRQVEEWWIDEGFPEDRDRVMRQLTRLCEGNAQRG